MMGREGAGGRTPMSTGCLRKSRVVSRDWSRSPLSVLPDSMTLCGSMSSRSMKEAVLGGPENMVCARRGLIMVSRAGVRVAWWVPYLEGLTLATRGAEPKGALRCRGRRGGGGNPSDVRHALIAARVLGR